MFKNNYRLGPAVTPFIVKILIFTILSISLINSLLYSSFPILEKIFSLSKDGIDKLYLWELISFSFLDKSLGINAGFLFSLAFNIYLLWIISTEIVLIRSQLQFAFFYILTIISTSSLIYLIMKILDYKLLFSSTAIPLYIVLVGWMMLMDKKAHIFLFFAFPIKLTHIVFITIGYSLINSLTIKNFIYFSAVLFGSLISYLYSVIVFQKNGPFIKLQKFENILIKIFSFMINRIVKK